MTRKKPCDEPPHGNSITLLRPATTVNSSGPGRSKHTHCLPSLTTRLMEICKGRRTCLRWAIIPVAKQDLLLQQLSTVKILIVPGHNTDTPTCLSKPSVAKLARIATRHNTWKSQGVE